MNKNNRFLFTIRSLTGGGSERVVSVLASNMAEDGYDVHIIAYDKNEHDYPISDKVKIHYMPNERRGFKGKIARIGDMRAIIEKIEPDIIIPFVGDFLMINALYPESINTTPKNELLIISWKNSHHYFRREKRSSFNKSSWTVSFRVQPLVQVTCLCGLSLHIFFGN